MKKFVYKGAKTKEISFPLGLCNSNESVAEDNKEAVSWYRKAANQGLSGAQFYLGNMYLDGIGVTKDYKIALSWFKKAAEQGYVKAQYNLAHYEEEETLQLNY